MDHLQICNRALAEAKQAPIDSLSENSESAKRFKLIYDDLRDELLAEFPWTFAKGVIELTASEEEVDGFSYLYEMPADVVTIRKSFTDTASSNPDPVDYEKIVNTAGDGHLLGMAYEDAYVEVTKRVTDPDMWSPGFREGLILRIGSKLAHALTGDKRTGDELANQAEIKISEAKRFDGNQRKRTAATRTSSYVSAR